MKIKRWSWHNLAVSLLALALTLALAYIAGCVIFWRILPFNPLFFRLAAVIVGPQIFYKNTD